MMLLLYAVVPADTPPPPGPGICGGPLTALGEHAVRLVVEGCRHPPEATKENVVAFGRVIKEMFRHGSVLPVRFGTTLPDEESVLDQLAKRADSWSEHLDSLAGQVEVVVHVRHEQTPARTGSGRDYLMSRVAASREEHQLTRDISSVVSATATDVRPLPSRNGVRVACLLPSSGIDDLKAQLGTWAAASHRDLVTTGPWPPFSFSEVSDQ